MNIIINNVTTSVYHICKGYNTINRSVHHTMNINLAEPFTIRCKIDQAIKLQDASKIIVITDAISIAKHIFLELF